MIELILQMIIFGLAGYGVGRTVVQESIFQGWVEKIKSWGYYPVSGPGVSQSPDGAIIRLHEDNTVEILSVDGYRIRRFRVVSLLLGKLADLVDCVFCLSAQVGFQLALWTIGITVLPMSVSVILATIAITYILNDWVNANNL